MVVIRQVKIFDLPALFIPKAGNVKCSVDHRVLILHRKGATVYEILDDPCPEGAEVITRKTLLECPKKIDSLSAGSSESILVGGNKRQILELLKDRIITPRGYQGIEFNNFFTKAEWSPVRVSDGPNRKSRCLLATITSNFQLAIYGQTEEIQEDDQNTWVSLLNLTKIFNAFLLRKWTTDGDLDGLRFQQYKKRLYELNCVDFAWMPQFDKVGEDMLGVSELFFISAQADGTIVIWWITISCPAKKVELVAEPVFQRCAFENEIISTMKFHRLSESSGILAVGTCSGSVRVYKIDKYRIEPDDQNEQARPSFTMSHGIEIWEKDLLSVDYFDFVPAEENILKTRAVDILFLKHPFHVCCCRITLCQDDIVCDTANTNSLPIPEGTIVGIDRYSEDLFMICHETGTLSLFYLKNGTMRYLEASANSIRDENISKRDNFVYNGFAFSTNKALAFVGKNLKCPYDHNAERDPGKLILFSTLPDDAWAAVKRLYIQRNYSLTKISDALLDFRFQIRVRKDYDVDQYSDEPGTGIFKMSPQFLPLYYWVLRCIQLPISEDWMKDSSLLEKRAKVLHRQAIVEDTLIQNYFLTVIQGVHQDQLSTLSLTEAQSLCAIQKYLMSKPNLDHAAFGPTLVPAIRPKCPICTADIEFKDLGYEPQQESPGLTITPGVLGHPFPGYVWNLQRCTNEHQFPICILTLLPCEGPFRTCGICHVVALENPEFGRRPECPLCGSMMLLADVLIDDGEEEDNEEEQEDILRNFGEQLTMEPEYVNVDVDVKLNVGPTDVDAGMPVPSKQSTSPRRTPRKKLKKEI